MFLAVKFYRDIVPRVSWMPDYWPAEVRELGDSQILPGPEWVLMTYEDFVRYKEQKMLEYLQWKTMQPQEPSVAGPEE